jgi:hypothetical protein
MATLLAKKAGQETPIALDDDHHEALANDPTISAFPQGSTFGGTNATTSTTASTSAFGAPASGGFGAPTGFGSPTPGATASTGFGAGTPVSGGTMQQHNQADLLKSGGGAMSEGGESTVKLDKDATDWINKKMRPMMGWIYMLTCTCDFVVFPVLWSLLQALSAGQVTSQWQPLTLQGAGLYHIAMGAVLGIAAYGRTKEKVAGVAS